MKHLYESLIIALGMYTRIPMPPVQWQERNLRGAVGFFPLAGVVIGALQYGLFLGCRALGVIPALYAALALALPVLVTGGLHLDGFCDVTDALSAHTDREKRLAILGDPHVGAFAVLYTVVLLAVRFGAWQQVYARPGQLAAVCCGYVLVRALAAILIVHTPKAKSTGLAALFAAPAGHGRTVALGLWCAAALALPVLLGGGMRALLVPLPALALLVYLRGMAKARFGGVTGDLAGYYIALSETLLLVLAALLGAPA